MVPLNGRAPKRYFFTINALDEFQIEALQSLTRTDIKSGLKNRVYRLVKLITRLIALVVFEIKFALIEVDLSCLNYFGDLFFRLLNCGGNVASRRAGRNLC